MAIRTVSDLTFVLVGGQLTFDDGSVVDSRQSFSDDPASRTVTRACLGEWGWWEVVQSLVAPLISSAEPSAYCLALTPRSVVIPRADGSFKRKRLQSLLSGGVGLVEVERLHTAEEKDGLSEDFDVVDRDNGGWLGLRTAGRPQWRFFEGNTFYRQQLAPDPHCKIVVVDPHRVANNVSDGNTYHSDTDRLIDEMCGGGEPLVILPHTTWTETLVNRFFERSTPKERPIDADFPSGTNPLSVVQPLVVSSTFGVTGFATISDGWQEPEALEAARLLVSSRFDIEVGLWDLVRNETLRTSLLEFHAFPDVPAPTTIPDSVRLRSEAKALAKDAVRERESALATAAANEALIVLSDLGWTGEMGGVLLPLAKPYARWPGQTAFPPLTLTFSSGRRRHSLVLATTEYNRVDLATEVTALCDAIEAITGVAPTSDARAGSNSILMEAAGGWGDDSFDLSPVLNEIRRVTPLLREVFAELAEKCARAARSHG